MAETNGMEEDGLFSSLCLNKQYSCVQPRLSLVHWATTASSPPPSTGSTKELQHHTSAVSKRLTVSKTITGDASEGF